LVGVPLVLMLLILALWRYMEQRFKATNQAYWSVITLTARAGKVTFDKPALSAGSPTHAGGVVFRTLPGAAEYLLAEATDDPDQWVLPKGHVEEGEHPLETAVREVHEETGVWARIIQDLGETTYMVNGADVTVRFYLMQAMGRGLRKDAYRQHAWLSLPQAAERASYLETRELLQAAGQRRVRAPR
jgi:8-oxo-dGTP pyrophosphatase MutT (NUDIX family)